MLIQFIKNIVNNFLSNITVSIEMQISKAIFNCTIESECFLFKQIKINIELVFIGQSTGQSFLKKKPRANHGFEFSEGDFRFRFHCAIYYLYLIFQIFYKRYKSRRNCHRQYYFSINNLQLFV